MAAMVSSRSLMVRAPGTGRGDDDLFGVTFPFAVSLYAAVVLEERMDYPPLVRVQGLRPDRLSLFSHLVPKSLRHGEDSLLPTIPEAVDVKEKLQILLAPFGYGEFGEMLQRFQDFPVLARKRLRVR